MGAARHARRRAWEHVQGLVRGVVPAGALVVVRLAAHHVQALAGAGVKIHVIQVVIALAHWEDNAKGFLFSKNCIDDFSVRAY